MMQHVMGRNKLKSLFSIVLVFSLLLNSFQSIAFADEPTSLEIGTVSGVPGDIVDVPVYINPGDYSVYGYRLNFTYNVNKLEPVTKVATSKWNTTAFDVGINTASTEVYVNSSFEEEHPIKDGKQEVFVLHFKIKETASEGSAHIIRTSGDYTASNGNVIVINQDTPGSVTINSNQGNGSGGSEPTEAQSPQITQQPLGKEVNLNDSVQLSVNATVSDGGVLSYQWYTLILTGERAIEGATDSSFEVPTTTAGTTSYFVKVKNTLGASSKIESSQVAGVTVNPAVAEGSWQDITGPEIPVDRPIDIAVDPNGTVYVANSTTIKMRSNNGNWIDITPEEGLEYISGMAADSTGAIYVSRSRSSSILKYMDGTWGIVNGTNEGLSTPVDVAVDEHDQIFVADSEFNTVKRLTNGTWENVSGSRVYTPVGLAVGNGNVYVTYDNFVEFGVKTLMDGVWEGITAGTKFYMPQGIAADASGNVYVADSYNHVVRKLSEGVWTTVSKASEFNIPYGVAISHNGDVYVADRENGHIKRLIVNAATPVIHAQPIGKTVDRGAEQPKLSINATVNDGGTLSYQWYSSTYDSVEDATLIEGATESSYSVPTNQEGKFYYYVKVKNTNAYAAQNQTASINSSVTAVTVNSAQLPAYNVFFNRQDGTTPFSMGVTQGSKIPVIIVKERAGYTFEGWYRDAAGTLKWNNDIDVVTSDVTLYAKWTANSASGEGGNGGGTGNGNTGGNSGSAGNAGGNSSANAGGTPASISIPTNDAVIVLVNGKEERIGKSAASTEGERTVTTITVDQQQLDSKLNSEGQGTVVTIPVYVESNIIVGEFTGQMIKKMEDKQAMLVVKTGNASYSIPAQQLDIDSISRQLGGAKTLDNIKLEFRIATPEATMMKVAEDVAKQNALTLVAPSFDFTVKAEYAGKSVAINKFNIYVERSIALPEGIDPNRITTGIVTDPDGSVRHVPTKVTVENGKYFAHINSLTNSLYSVVWHPLMFKDVENHWAKDAVNDMGSRLIVNGSGNDLYNPNVDMTRAEFAAIMMRGLGLKPVDGNSPFSDVKASTWYHSAVLTAYDYKLIDGFEDGTFRPQEKITREQAMVILSKAMAMTGLTDNLAVKGSDELLKPYKDASLVAEWAKVGVGTSLEAGVVRGRGAEHLAPKANITRAEVAAIVQRLLKVSGLI